MDFTFKSLIEYKMCWAVYDYIDSISYIEGFPVKDIIFYIWSIVLDPGNIGLPLNIYPNIHPKLHISAGDP